MSILFLGRKPIIDTTREVPFYQLSYKNFIPKEQSAIVAIKEFTQNFIAFMQRKGVQAAIEDKPVFVKVNDQLLIKSYFEELLGINAIFEVTETQTFSIKLANIIEELHTKGMRFAVSQTIVEEIILKKGDAFLAYFDYIVFNVRRINFDTLMRYEKLFKKHNIKLIGQQVQTYQGFNMCQRLGFDYFVGSFYQEAVSTNKPQQHAEYINAIKLINATAHSDYETIVDILQQDKEYANKFIAFSVHVTHEAINTLDDALMHTPSTMALLFFVYTFNSTNEHTRLLIDTAILRAFMMQKIAPKSFETLLARDTFFMGVFSVLDALFLSDYETLQAHSGTDLAYIDALLDDTTPLGTLLQYAKLGLKAGYRQTELLQRKTTMTFEDIDALVEQAYLYLHDTRKQLSTIS